MSKAEWMRQNLKKGDQYAGLILGKNGEQDYHLILLPGSVEKVTWDKAKEWAAQNGGELPTRREQTLLFSNLREEFQPNWYWSGEQHASTSVHAWLQGFYYGYQDYNHKSYEGRARAVRRLIIL